MDRSVAGPPYTGYNELVAASREKQFGGSASKDDELAELPKIEIELRDKRTGESVILPDHEYEERQ